MLSAIWARLTSSQVLTVPLGFRVHMACVHTNQTRRGAPPVGAAVMSEIPNMEEILKRVVTLEKTVPLCLHIFYRGC